MRVVWPEGNDRRRATGNPRPWGGRRRTAGQRVLGLCEPPRKVPDGPAITALLLCTPIMRFLDDYLAATQSGRRAPTIADVSPPDRATLEAHLARRRYGRFTLTDAVRPSWQLDVVPQAGYRFDTYVDPSGGAKLPALVGAVSSEDLFEAFLGLLEPLGDTVDVVLESSHGDGGTPVEVTREGVERTVLESVLWDFENLLLDDGCTGIAVLHPERPIEVQLDEHKLLIVYAHARSPFEHVFADLGLGRDDRMRFISQGEHLHTSHERFAARFEELAQRLGAG